MLVVEGHDTPRGQHDLDAARLEDRAEPHVDERPRHVAARPPVARLAGARDATAQQQARLADLELDLRACRRCGRLGRLRVVEDGDGAARPGLDERPDDVRAVARRAAPDVVGHLREHRQPVRGEGMLDRVGDPDELGSELVATAPHLACELVGDLTCHRPIGSHEDGEAEPVDVRVREPRREAYPHDARPCLQPARLDQQIGHGLCRGRLGERTGQQRHAARGDGRRDFPVDRFCEEAGRLGCALGHVRVRIRVVGEQDVRLLHEGIAGIRVEVDHDRDRSRARELAHAADELGFGILGVLGHHGAVEAEENPIRGQRLLEPRQERAAQSLVGLRGDERARHGRGVEERLGLETELGAGGERTAELGGGALGLVSHGTRSLREPVGREVGERRPARRERVRLVPEPADRDSWAHVG